MRASQNIVGNVVVVVFLLVIVDCALSENNPRGMDYELRRPITYLYNRLAYKFGKIILTLDFNPYTSHLIDTDSQCSSRTGPYCKFINQK